MQCPLLSPGLSAGGAPRLRALPSAGRQNADLRLPGNGRHRMAGRAEMRAAAAATAGVEVEKGSHVAMLQGLGEVGDVSAANVPWLLRLAHIRAQGGGGDSAEELRESARGLLVWGYALDRGLLPDDETLMQVIQDGESFASDHTPEELRWPEEPLRTALLRGLAKLGVARFAKKYPGVKAALLQSLLATICKYYRIVLGIPEEVQELPATDEKGQKYTTIADLKRIEAEQRAVRANKQASASVVAQEKKEKARVDRLAGLPPDRRAAIEATKALYQKWQAPMDALSKAGRAFEGLECLLGGGRSGIFNLQGNIWSRKGWAQMDDLRQRLEDMKELRDLVRSLGRGGGWGPLRRAPIQYLDMKGRDGLLRTILEAQETRGLTRSDDISRLLPGEAALIARGRSVRRAKLLFFARLAEKGLNTYERDGWGEFPTNIIPERREIRPTADRGPILLCVDTSGSMRGPRETVAKALTLECMREAQEQDRGCYVFAFAGLQEVRELELNQDMKSVNNLLDFLEKVFNGGSDFNEPIKRCLDRLTDAKWANSDILLVSDGELRQPGQEIMRKLAGAKEKLGLVVHGLIIGSPEKRRADPAVLKSLCTNYLANGKAELRVSEFENWGSVQEDKALQFDWDDIAGDTARRLVNLEREKLRLEEIKRRRLQKKAEAGGIARKPRKKKH